LPDPELGFIDERRVSLGQLLGGVGDRLLYTYDFGDDWEHEIVVEELLDADPEARYPVLVAAKGACPPEDCGGPWGYAELKEILADSTHERHQECSTGSASRTPPRSIPAPSMQLTRGGARLQASVRVADPRRVPPAKDA